MRTASNGDYIHCNDRTTHTLNTARLLTIQITRLSHQVNAQYCAFCSSSLLFETLLHYELTDEAESSPDNSKYRQFFSGTAINIFRNF